MDQETLRDTWEELCFQLSDNITPTISEHDFEQKVLHSFEKLGWSQRKGELKVRHSLQIGSQGRMTPDIVAYTPDNKAAVVLEIKRPAEDLSKSERLGQLRSYMRQTKADFGLLVGKEIYVYYDGILNPHAEPLLLSNIRFKSDSTEGTDFVRLFNRNSFVAGEYKSYLKAHIDRLDQEQRIEALKEQLQSEETRHKLFKFLKNEFRESETQILMEAMEGLTVIISYQQDFEKKKYAASGAAVSNILQSTVSVCRNKASGKHFIYIDELRDNKALLITPDGVQTALSANLFEQPKEESKEYLLSRKLITEIQLEKYTEYESQQSEEVGTSIENYPVRIKPKRLPGPGRTKTPSPSAYEWSRGVPELSRLPDHVTWTRICDYLKVEHGGNSARRALRDWVKENRRDWQRIPEPEKR